ncbi:MAG: recombinase family protein [Lachnospiraceae bacterium]|nr:recombinase family protein [Lachnospiraceae bacterium]
MMKKAVIFARVSSTTGRQDTARQVSDLTAYAQLNGLNVVCTFEEHISGSRKNTDRKVLEDCLTYCERECIDMLLISELSRLGRSVWEVQETVKRCIDKGINIYFQREQFSLFTPEGKPNPFVAVFVSVLGTCAEMEREAIYFRLNSGRAKYIAEGGKLGRKQGSAESNTVFLSKYPGVVKRLRKGQSVRDTAKCENVSTGTVQKCKRLIGKTDSVSTAKEYPTMDEALFPDGINPLL